ncbi:hypothetical protein AnigIFM56816_000192 [Aspergillus niger]|nr:hypothetical protein AnigIFM56816_000192 [Aspergillus niger]
MKPRFSPRIRQTRYQSRSAEVEFRSLCRALSSLLQELSPQATDDTREFRHLCRKLSLLLEDLSLPCLADPLEQVADDSPSRREWIRLKRTEGARSESLDTLMQMVGLEQAKQLFLDLRAKIQIANKQKRILSSSDLNIVIVGNRGIGKSRIKTLYANFLRELGITRRAYIENEESSGSEDNFMRVPWQMRRRTSGPPAASSKIRLELPDYSNEELQHLLARTIAPTPYLNNLSAYLSWRYDRTGNLDDLEAAIRCARDAVNLSNAFPSHRVTAARRAIRLLAAQSLWHDAAHVANTAIYLLPLVCSRYLSRDDQQHAIAQTAGLAADAGSIFLRLTQPAKALQLLEFGRGLILGYQIDSRSDPETLYADHPSLAQEYDRLRFILSRPVDSGDARSQEDLIHSKQNAPRELERCLATIREQPGYERFLLEPAIEELVAQAQEGPLVTVNITDFGSHAVIVLDHHVFSLELPPLLNITHFNMDHLISRFRTVGQRGPHSPRDLQNEMEVLHPLLQIAASYYDTASLSWLWEHYVAPIVDAIERRMPEKVSRPRIWWIGTGVANALPFHAAGLHDGSTQNTLDCAISSYTPTIKALAYARSCLKRTLSPASPASVVIVAMPTTPQGHPLPGVEAEIAAVQQAAGSLYRVQIQQHPGSEDVLQAIQETDIVHFACHGFCDPVDPSDSHLLLQNNRTSPPVVDPLSVKRISELVLRQARIAFLSACSTAQVTAHRLTDEAIHLASAFQVAGFGHVIASLWSADDAACAAIARAFYGYLAQEPARLFSNRSVAEALHDAVLEVRQTERPGVWASFVHYGA